MESWDQITVDELMHYGIKGQKWGVRRFQEEDGSLTPAGRERYDDDNVGRDSIKTPDKKQSNNRTLDEKQNNTIFTKKNIAIGAAAAVTALAVIGCMRYSHNKNNLPGHTMEIVAGKKIKLDDLPDTDRILKQGTKFQRISSRKFEDYVGEGKAIYMSFEKKDNRIYKEAMPRNIANWRKSGVINDDTTDVFKHTLTMNKDIKVASQRKVAEVYKKVTGCSEIEHHKYMNFMTGLSDRNNKVNKSFFKELIDMGYNAIVDDNDAGHYTKTPLILLDAGKHISNSKVSKIGVLEQIINVLLM